MKGRFINMSRPFILDPRLSVTLIFLRTTSHTSRLALRQAISWGALVSYTECVS